MANTFRDIAASQEPWTRKDEERFAAISAEYSSKLARRGEALGSLCVLWGTMNKHMTNEGADQSKVLVLYAAQLRDALEPFDSGVREAKAPSV